jgi:hypothetical protein
VGGGAQEHGQERQRQVGAQGFRADHILTSTTTQRAARCPSISH